MARLLFFGSLGDLMGRSRAFRLPEDPATVERVIEWLAREDAAFGAVVRAGRIKIAVNETIVEAAHPVTDGDEIAFLPPFSGG